MWTNFSNKHKTKRNFWKKKKKKKKKKKTNFFLLKKGGILNQGAWDTLFEMVHLPSLIHISQ